MRDDISYYQKKLRLSKSLVEIYESISYDNKDQFMHDLLKTLYEERMVNIIERNIKSSRFPNLKTFDDFSYKDITFPERFTPEIMESLDFIDKKENPVILWTNRIWQDTSGLSTRFECIKTTEAGCVLYLARSG